MLESDDDEYLPSIAPYHLPIREQSLLLKELPAEIRNKLDLPQAMHDRGTVYGINGHDRVTVEIPRNEHILDFCIVRRIELPTCVALYVDVDLKVLRGSKDDFL